jgi:aspartyl-tRNA(Asn)/glutamyl-tRNA(Gln) amidotransferase subunit B
LLTSEITMRLRAAGLELDQSPVSMDGWCSPPTSPNPASSPASMLKQLLDLLRQSEDFPAVYEREKPQQISDTSASKP